MRKVTGAVFTAFLLVFVVLGVGLAILSTQLARRGHAHGDDAPVIIAVIADAVKKRPAPVYATVASHNPDIVLQIGDWDHGFLRNETGIRRMYAQVSTCAGRAGCDFETHLSRFPFLHMWDDHDLGCRNNANRNCPTNAIARAVYKELYPWPYPGSGIWRSVVVGPVRIFALDSRSHASPDIEPDGPQKTVLGQEQEAWLLNELTRAIEPWKLLIATRPFNGTAKPNDSWAGYPTARQRLINSIQSTGVEGVVIVSGDEHSGGAIDNGTHSAFPEMGVPHSNLPSGNACLPDRISNQYCGDWSEGFISGIGKPGYGLVIGTSTTLRFEVRGLGAEVRLLLELQK